ncbi:MAG: carboxypeptidase regulatory-like domain-containing protein [Isosphaeraceae bacterium]
MLMLLSPLLAVMVFAQAQPARTTTGEVVDDQGKAVADAQVVLYAPPLVSGKEDTAEAQTRTDAKGQFDLKIPPFRRIGVNGVNFLAYRPGLAISAKEYFRRPHRLVLEKPEPRPVRVEGPEGRPIAGVRIAPLIVYVFNKSSAVIPETLAAPLAVVTGSDGRATLNYLAARDQLVAVRVSADSIGTQDFLLVDRPGRGSVEPVIAIKLRKTSRLAGRIVDGAGEPVADQVVEVWSRGGGNSLRPNSVELRGGPLRTSADGRFQTPDNLLVGSTYRIVVRASGKVPILSDWITIDESSRTLLPMKLLSLRTVDGRVVDRQGKPVANAEVFQTGDGPEETATRTDVDGRFSLGGFRQGPVFLFVRGDGFRFQGRLIRESESEATVDLTRTTERPSREMKMLPEPIPLEESRAMARRLVEPLWKVAVEKGDDAAKSRVLEALVNADPAEVLDRLESAKFVQKERAFQIQSKIVAALAGTDPEEAAAVAESIADPAWRTTALIELIDALPEGSQPRKLALLDRAAIQARTIRDSAERLDRIGGVAERLYELGEVERARALFAEGLRIANQLADKTDSHRGNFAAALALVDLPTALAIAKEFEVKRTAGGIRAGIALRVMERDPAEAERLWKDLRGGRLGLLETLCWKMARVDPGRARRIITGFPWLTQRPEMLFFLALGAQARDPSASRQAFEEGLRAIDRLMQEQPERFQFFAYILLPVVERIDPALLPEIFWRVVAARPSFGNPRTSSPNSPNYSIQHLFWYDREVAAALFEPTRERMEHIEDRELATWDTEFRAWSLFDPRAAVARLEKVPVVSETGARANSARTGVARSLGEPYELRWRRYWAEWQLVLGGSRQRLRSP